MKEFEMKEKQRRMTSEDREIVRANEERILFKKEHQKWMDYYIQNIKKGPKVFIQFGK